MELEDAAGQSGSDDLPQELARLERRLASGDATRGRVIDELARVRHDLVRGGDRAPGLRLADLRIASPCKQSWADMVGDDRVRACRGCDRPVFNLSEMTRAQAEAVLATRGVTPCVRFYRRADGTVMTTDCPTGTRHDGRRLTMVASTLAAGAALAGASPVRADPDPAQATAEPPAPGTDIATPPDPAADPGPPAPAPSELIPVDRRYIVDMWMGIPPPRYKPPRATLEWSTWTRLGVVVASQAPAVAAAPQPSGAIARSITPPMTAGASSWEAAVAAELSLPVARGGDLRVGAWAELRTSSDPVLGGELVVEGLPPHPYIHYNFSGAGSLVLRAGGNAHVVTGAVAFGYIGTWSRSDPWIEFADHLVGVRLVASLNRSTDAAPAWSATLGIEFEPIGVIGYALGFGRR